MEIVSSDAYSKILSGSEKHHVKLRGEICRYMVTEGRNSLGWYFTQVHSTTPAQYLRTRSMTVDGKWGGDVELMAISAILQTDIYVANIYEQADEVSEIRWSRIRSSNLTQTDAANSIYISNFHYHYEPVCKMMNSTTKSYFDGADNIQEVILVE